MGSPAQVRTLSLTSKLYFLDFDWGFLFFLVGLLFSLCAGGEGRQRKGIGRGDLVMVAFREMVVRRLDHGGGERGGRKEFG